MLFVDQVGNGLAELLVAIEWLSHVERQVAEAIRVVLNYRDRGLCPKLLLEPFA